VTSFLIAIKEQTKVTTIEDSLIGGAIKEQTKVTATEDSMIGGSAWRMNVS